MLQFEVSAYGLTYELKAQRIDDAVYLTQPAHEDRDDPGADDEIGERKQYNQALAGC